MKYLNKMKYPFAKQIYDLLLAHCGEHRKIIGASNTLKRMSEGNINLTHNTISNLLNDNGMPSELFIKVKIEGKTGKTKIPF